MKKRYTPPDVLFESFALSTSIAGGCEAIIDGFRGGQCGINFGGRKVIFTEDVSGCTTPVEDGSAEHNGLCYHVPNPSNNVFNS